MKIVINLFVFFWRICLKQNRVYILKHFFCGVPFRAEAKRYINEVFAELEIDFIDIGPINIESLNIATGIFLIINLSPVRKRCA